MVVDFLDRSFSGFLDPSLATVDRQGVRGKQAGIPLPLCSQSGADMR